MKMLKVVCLIGALVGALGIANAADASGNWVAQVMREGHSVAVAFDLKAAGDKLTGTVSQNGRSQNIVDGKVNGNNITFAVVRTVEEKTYRTDYTATQAGDEMKIVGMMGPRKIMDTTAKRSK